MTTRATVTVYDDQGEFHLSINKECSYAKVLYLLSQAKGFTWDKPIFEAGDYAAAIIRVMKEDAGDVSLVNAIDNYSYCKYHINISFCH